MKNLNKIKEIALDIIQIPIRITDKGYSVFFLLITICLLHISCGKFLDVGAPKDAATPLEIFANDAIATSAVTGIYARMASNVSAFSGGTNSITVISGLTSDELKSYNVSLDAFYKNNIPTAQDEIINLWANAYAYIYTANAILKGLDASNTLSVATKQQLQGESKFVRAFYYFYLVNLFGEVPLNLTTDYRINKISAKSTTDNIYAQIITDLVDAENLLSPNYITTERVRPNKWAAKALLSRVYLYMGRWELAAQKATEVINQKQMYMLIDDLDKVFLKNSSEAIWQLMPPAGNNTNEGKIFVLVATPTDISLSEALVQSFEPGDNRKVKWTGLYTNASGSYYYPNKYKVRVTGVAGVTEYSMILRLAEIYLIRAEARAKLEQTNLALEDINLIRNRAGLTIPLVGLNSMQSLAEVERQRQFELFTEWGHRWLDLKRTGRVSIVCAALKGVNWSDTDALYPIPDSEIKSNPNVSPNLGY